jgi:hypothetical protein
MEKRAASAARKDRRWLSIGKTALVLVLVLGSGLPDLRSGVLKFRSSQLAWFWFLVDRPLLLAI